ncbi:hypothetical protein Pdw03_4932 [Penicillium digitatum]|uniref:Uncharacterized protein n=1 Tax=Penicillium digitatum TaxID=36651 RepID=A0A7T6XJ25_PENDI|nr:hypothetical protein Pdw03_4932 [Penicillium digitatum]
MGITESKILLGKLATACSSAERNRQTGIQHVLSDKQFVKCLATLWNNLPGPSKDEITGPQPDPVAMFYQELSVAETRSAGDAIRLRFLKVVFHHLKDRFCVSYLQPDAVNWLATRVAAAGLDGGDAGKISDKIKNWAYLGGKYDALCRDIGNYNVVEDCKYLGNLIRLPDDVTDRFVLKELKVKGPDREREVDSLTRRGVYQSNKENDDIDCLADTIFGHMWNQIEPCIPPGDIECERIFCSLKGCGIFNPTTRLLGSERKGAHHRRFSNRSKNSRPNAERDRSQSIQMMPNFILVIVYYPSSSTPRSIAVRPTAGGLRVRNYLVVISQSQRMTKFVTSFLTQYQPTGLT